MADSIIRTVLTADTTNFSNNMKRAADSLNVFADVAKIAVGAFAVDKLVRGFNAVVQAASDSEKANKKLVMSLASAGDLSDANVIAFRDMASELQAVTAISDETILGLASLAINMGATAKQAKSVVPAAVDLAAALGVDVESATRMLTKTLSGNTKELGKAIPEVKRFTEAQLESGAAIDLIAQKFHGFAAGEMDTMTGSIEKAKVGFAELEESIGRIVTSSPEAKGAIAGIGDAMLEAAKMIDNNSADIKVSLYGIGNAALEVGKFVLGLLGPLAQLADGILAPFQLVVGAMVSLFGKMVAGLTKALQLAAKGLSKFGGAFGESMKGLADGLDGVPTQISEIGDSVAKFINQFDMSYGVEQSRKALSALQDDLQTKAVAAAQAAPKALAEGYKNAVKESAAAVKDFSEAAFDIEVGGAFAEIITDAIAEFKKNQEAELQWNINADILLSESLDEDIANAIEQGGAIKKAMAQQFIDSVSGLGNSIYNAAKGGLGGLTSFVTEIFAKAIESSGAKWGAIIGKLAPVFGGIVETLATTTPEQFAQMIEALIQGFITAMQNIGPFIAVLASHIDDIAIGVFQGLALGFVSLAKSLPDIAIGLIKSFGNVTWEIMKAFGTVISTAVSWIVQGLGKIFNINEIFAGLTDSIKSFFAITVRFALADMLRWIDGAVDSVGKFFAKIGNFFIDIFNKLIRGINKIPGIDIDELPHFHTGGIVPGPVGAEVPIMAQAGERIIPLSDSPEDGGATSIGNVTFEIKRLSPGEMSDEVLQAVKMLVRSGHLSPMTLRAV